jgi:hypothetical protein
MMSGVFSVLESELGLLTGPVKKMIKLLLRLGLPLLLVNFLRPGLHLTVDFLRHQLYRLAHRRVRLKRMSSCDEHLICFARRYVVTVY